MHLSGTIMPACIVPKHDVCQLKFNKKILSDCYASIIIVFFFLIKILSFQSTPKTGTSSVMMNIMKETMIMIRTWKMYELTLSTEHYAYFEGRLAFS